MPSLESSCSVQMTAQSEVPQWPAYTAALRWLADQRQPMAHSSCDGQLVSRAERRHLGSPSTLRVCPNRVLFPLPVEGGAGKAGADERAAQIHAVGALLQQRWRLPFPASVACRHRRPIFVAAAAGCLHAAVLSCMAWLHHLNLHA